MTQIAEDAATRAQVKFLCAPAAGLSQVLKGLSDQLEESTFDDERAAVRERFGPILAGARASVKEWRTDIELIRERTDAALELMDSLSRDRGDGLAPLTESVPGVFALASALARIDDRAVVAALAVERLPAAALHAAYICADSFLQSSLNPELRGLTAIKQICVSHPNADKMLQETALRDCSPHDNRICHFTATLPTLHPDLAKAICRSEFPAVTPTRVAASSALSFDELMENMPPFIKMECRDQLAARADCKSEFFSEFLPRVAVAAGNSLTKRTIFSQSKSAFIEKAPLDLLLNCLRAPSAAAPFVILATRQRGAEIPAEIFSEKLRTFAEQSKAPECAELLESLPIKDGMEFAESIQLFVTGSAAIVESNGDIIFGGDAPAFMEHADHKPLHLAHEDRNESVEFTCEGVATGLATLPNGRVAVRFEVGGKSYPVNPHTLDEISVLDVATGAALTLQNAIGESRSVKI